jgi:hypothetical protein
MLVMKSSRIFAVVLAGALAACSGSATAPGQTGDIAINVAAIATGPQTVLVRLYGPTTVQPGAPAYIDQVIAAQSVAGAGVFTATFPSVPAGTYQVHAKGYDAFDVPPADYGNPAVAAIWESAGIDPTVTVSGGNTSTTNLFMQEIGVPTFSNNAPFVSAISSDVTSVFSGTNGGQSTIANLTATLIDADADLLGYSWTDDVGGTFGTPGGALTGASASVATTWTPPGSFAGTAHLYLEVNDSILNASRVSLTLTVQQTPGYGTVIVNVAFNNNPMMSAPLVANYIQDPNTGAIIGGGGQIAPGADTILTVAAWDPNGDVLAFNFSDTTCAGTFGTPTITGTGTLGDPYAAQVIYTAASTPVVGFTTCTLRADILDGNGGELIVNLGITVGLP